MFEGDHINLERQARDLLGFDPGDRTDAVRRIDNVIPNGEFELAASAKSSGPTPSLIANNPLRHPSPMDRRASVWTACLQPRHHERTGAPITRMSIKTVSQK
jgi:hypothetical protein